MLSERSIRGEFIKQLVVASVALIAIFSLILYGYIKSSFLQEIEVALLEQAKTISISNKNYTEGTVIDVTDINSIISSTLSIKIQKIDNLKKFVTVSTYKMNKKDFFQLIYPYNLNDGLYLVIIKDITSVNKFLNRILNSILIINIAFLILIIIYAIMLSNTLLKPITSLTKKLTKMNEKMLKSIEIPNLPIEFVGLANSINRLIMRLDTFIKYQKELFIGLAHELKTPLAVMKLKNEVTLIKKREEDKYIEAIKLNISSINDMNKMIGNILEIGRQESDQFEEHVEIDLISFLQKKGEDFKLLAKSENKNLTINLSPQKLNISIQPTLLTHIIQNFLQNAIKFTPEGKNITLDGKVDGKSYIISVIDEGCGIKDGLDIFAPFKRAGEKSGTGLGLFLAKNASEAMNAEISVKNRDDGVSGAIAKVTLKL